MQIQKRDFYGYPLNTWMLTKALELFTLFALVNFPKHIDTISRDCQFCVVNNDVFLPLNVVFTCTCNLPKSVDLCGI